MSQVDSEKSGWAERNNIATKEDSKEKEDSTDETQGLQTDRRSTKTHPSIYVSKEKQDMLRKVDEPFKQARESVCDKLKIGYCLLSDRRFPWYQSPFYIGVPYLLIRRGLLRKFNLLHPEKIADDHKVSSHNQKTEQPGGHFYRFRPEDGAKVDETDEDEGALGSLFGRNCPPAHDRQMDNPSPFLVAEKLLQRRATPTQPHFKPAGDQLNVLAACWIQFMVHDWMDHEQGKAITITNTSGISCPMNEFKTRESVMLKAGDNAGPARVGINSRTPWWDASVTYGQNAEEVKQGRTFKDGKIIVDEDGCLTLLPETQKYAGDRRNPWIGISVLQGLFSLEHNRIAEMLAKNNPEWDDERIFQTTRLVVSAVEAKIHTIDWTPELLKTDMLAKSMYINWYGFCGKTLRMKFGHLGNEVLSGLTGQKQSHDRGVPFSFTEEFTAVYRLHPLLPDALNVPNQDGETKVVPLHELIGPQGEPRLKQLGIENVFSALGDDPCGNLQLMNYPSFMRNLKVTDDYGALIPHNVDMAALDIYRDRERNIPRYNNFRRSLNMEPLTCWEDMTTDPEELKALRECYGEDVELCDLLVGQLGEKKIPGFAISETSFHIFILMASRRLEADPYFTEYFNEETYTKEGLAWVEDTMCLNDVLERNMPNVRKMVKTPSAFKPWKATTPAPFGTFGFVACCCGPRICGHSRGYADYDEDGRWKNVHLLDVLNMGVHAATAAAAVFAGYEFSLKEEVISASVNTSESIVGDNWVYFVYMAFALACAATVVSFAGHTIEGWPAAGMTLSRANYYSEMFFMFLYPLAFGLFAFVMLEVDSADTVSYLLPCIFLGNALLFPLMMFLGTCCGGKTYKEQAAHLLRSPLGVVANILVSSVARLAFYLAWSNLLPDAEFASLPLVIGLVLIPLSAICTIIQKNNSSTMAQFFGQGLHLADLAIITLALMEL